MMADKKKMLTTADLGLTESKEQIRRTFEFFERVRNHVAHPSAEFTRDWDLADQLALANHERIEDDETWRAPFATLVEEQLNVTEIELAKAVRECHEVIADIDRAVSVRA